MDALSVFSEISALQCSDDEEKRPNPSAEDWATVALAVLLLGLVVVPLRLCLTTEKTSWLTSKRVESAAKRHAELELVAAPTTSSSWLTAVEQAEAESELTAEASDTKSPKGEGDGDGEGDSRGGGGLTWSCTVVCIANALYSTASLYALTGPSDFQFWFVLFFYVVPVLALVGYMPAMKRAKVSEQAQAAGRIVITAGGVYVGWFVCGSAVNPLFKVAMSATQSGPWCDMYARSRTFAHLIVNLLSTLGMAGASGVTMAYFLTSSAPSHLVYLGALLVAPSRAPVAGASSTSKTNVLFVMTDDMRPEMSGKPYSAGAGTATPHLDRLMTESTVFTHAYSQGVKCMPSRASLMTGLRQPTAGYWFHPKPMQEAGAPSIAHLFKDAGYRTLGAGKTFHNQDQPDNWDQENSWTEPYIPFDKVRYCHSGFG